MYTSTSQFHLKSMKTPRRFTQLNRILSFLRFGSGLILISAAFAMAFVANKPSGPALVGKSDQLRERFNKFRHDPDEYRDNKVVSPGPERDRGPLSAAEEAYDIRAYPATEIPFSATLNAQVAFNKVKSQSVGKGKNVTGQWTLIGPSNADFPSYTHIQRRSDHDFGPYHGPRN